MRVLTIFEFPTDYCSRRPMLLLTDAQHIEVRDSVTNITFLLFADYRARLLTRVLQIFDVPP